MFITCTWSKRIALLSTAVLLPFFLIAQEKVDLSIINRIRAEAFENSKVMDHLFYLTDVYGPRLAGSPQYKAAAEWVVKRMGEYGIKAKLEKVPFGRGWTYSHFEAHMIEPQYAPLIGFPLAWSPGTDGTVSGEPVLAVIRTEADMEKYKGKLKGKIVMTSQPRDLIMWTASPGVRYSDTELAELASAPEPGRMGFSMPGADLSQSQQRPGSAPSASQQQGMMGGQPPINRMQARQLRTKITKFMAEEAPALVLQSGTIGDGGTVFAASAGSRDIKDPVPPPTVAITPEHYNRIARLLDHNIPVKLAFNIQAQVLEDAGNDANVIADIEGGRKKDEIVFIGAHLDSWHGGTGATDNGTGSAVMIETMRILKSLNVKFDRTIRMGLWDGEEEGLIGSRAYVKEHYADPATMKLTAEHGKVSAYYNDDNGSGRIRGIYLQGNDMAKPIFQEWLKPFSDLGATTVTIRNTGGTDHQSFDGVGIPAFQFIQDPLEYNSRTHHSNMDVYDRVQKGDLMQAAAVIASFVYNTAMREDMIPRKPLPKPRPNMLDTPETPAPAKPATTTTTGSN
jgi:carboxypeptidase Q